MKTKIKSSMSFMTKTQNCILLFSLLFSLNYLAISQEIDKNKSDIFIFHNTESAPFVWEVEVPDSVNWPLKNSKKLKNVKFTGRFANYTKADTYYPSWASDGNLYSPWTDGSIAGEKCNSWSGKKARTGQVIIKGNDPMNLEFESLGTMVGSASPYSGRYPCGSLVYNGIWYYGTYTLNWGTSGLNWPYLGPFAGFRISKDMGKTWEESTTSCTPGETLFPEPKEVNGPLKIGAPHFVDFGQNMEYSPDGKAYLVGHGATELNMVDRDANLSWVTGDQIYLCRVMPSPENMNNEEAYEYFAGNDKKGKPVWSDDFEKIQPIIDWDNNTGCVTMTYNAPLKKYIMCVTDGWPTVGTMNTYLLESDNITGPWKMVTYMKDFGPQAYFVNIPSKFISDDGLTMWLLYSANFTNEEKRNTPEYLKTTTPVGSAYSMSLHEFRIKKKQ